MRVVWCVCLKRRVVGSESRGCFGGWSWVGALNENEMGGSVGFCEWWECMSYWNVFYGIWNRVTKM